MDAAAGEFARRPVAAPRPARGLAPVLGLALGLAPARYPFGLPARSGFGLARCDGAGAGPPERASGMLDSSSTCKTIGWNASKKLGDAMRS